MGLKLTKDQQYAVDLRNRKLLVSAAAGSGKTAVLVKRIIDRILDNKDPIDIDELLVMTFTKAAAAQMRERVLKSLEAYLDNTDINAPEHVRIREQVALIDSAKITTIDSFCLSIIRDHTDKTNLDPAFRVADEGEISLIKMDVMEAVLEKHFEDSSEKFLDFVDSFAKGKTDFGISEIIMSVYNYAQATPWPNEWYEEQIKQIQTEKAREAGFDKLPWLMYITDQIVYTAKEILKKQKYAIEICEEEGGPFGYLATIQYEKELTEKLSAANKYSDIEKNIKLFDWPRIGRVGKDTDVELKDIVKNIRDNYKNIIKDLSNRFVQINNFGIEKEIDNAYPTLITVVNLAKEFDKKYTDKKTEKNVVDFNDIEHIALNILWDTDNNTKVKSNIAMEYADQFKEIYVDEYQDSNYVQEELLSAIEKGCIFMVGDVKQSIYAFRQARPELFYDKYRTYTKYTGNESDSNIRIDLSSNFRSRSTVLESVNSVFFKIMTEGLGGIDYNQEVALNPGLQLPDSSTSNTAGKTQLLICSTDNIEEEYDKKEIEARMVADRIRELTDEITGIDIYDNETESYRKLVFSDIAILLRAQNGWADTFVNILMNAGIPAHAQTTTGYFDTIEVKTILNLLLVIDNPLQDIALAAVLKSPIVNMTDKELSCIVATFRQKNTGQYRLYYALNDYKAIDKEPDISKKISKMLMMLDIYSSKSKYIRLTDLLNTIYYETGYYEYASAMPAGSVRKANLDMLMEKAEAFENTGYQGLFQFNRYIENLKKYDTDYGEASTVSENDNSVRIMSIHKSKGLEFPVCFVSGMNKRFNLMDANSGVVTDSVLGIACDYIDLDLRLKLNSIKKNVFSYKMKSESLGEELRVLYVAMTRARDLLIMTSADTKLIEKKEKYDLLKPREQGPIMISDIRNASSYLDWVFMCISNNDNDFNIRTYEPYELISNEKIIQKKKTDIKKMFDNIVIMDTIDELDYEKFVYPYQEDVELHTKMSVSELKKSKLDLDDSRSFDLFDTSKQKDLIEGSAIRGTAYHKIMEKLNYDKVVDLKSFTYFVNDLLKKNTITQEEVDMIDPNDILALITSETGKIIKTAFKNKCLFREKQFTMGIEADELDVASSKETILIQGIIDAYIEYDDELILVDYKTDKVNSGEELKKRYIKQLELYSKALSMIKKKPIAKRIIWSFYLNRAFIV